MKQKITVTFNLDYLQELALREASTLALFSGKDLTSRGVFTEDIYFQGIEVIAEEES